MITVAVVLPTGVLLPESILHSDSFEILATFVALNSLMYATLAVLKILPKGYALFRFNGRNRRTQNRSIYPEPLAPESSGSGERPSGLADDLLGYDPDAPARPARPIPGRAMCHDLTSADRHYHVSRGGDGRGG